MTEQNNIKLLDAKTDDGDGTVFQVDIHQAAVFVSGEFDGATVKLLGSPDNVLWFESADGTFTDVAWAVTTLGQIYVKGNVSDAGDDTEITMQLRPIVTTVAKL